MSQWIYTLQKAQTIPYEATHIYHLIFFDESPATNSLYPDEMPKEPYYGTHDADLYLSGPSVFASKLRHLQGRDCDPYFSF